MTFVDEAGDHDDGGGGVDDLLLDDDGDEEFERAYGAGLMPGDGVEAWDDEDELSAGEDEEQEALAAVRPAK